MTTTSIKSKPSYINPEVLNKAISYEYTEVACNPEHDIHFTSGLPLAKRLKYPVELLARLPGEAIRPFAGVGNPFMMGEFSKGEVILDVGCGAGFDCLVASIVTDKSCEIYGMDMTKAMLEKARENAKETGAKNVWFIEGNAHKMPVISNGIDTVISNGVINLCHDKLKVYKEIFRVLKPGGRFMIADVMLNIPVPEESRALVHLWTNCVAGAIPKEDYLEIIAEAGFEGVVIKTCYDVFKDAKLAKSAAYFGAKGYNIIGYKPKY